MDAKVIFSSSVDICEAHGIWLDRGELHSIIARVRAPHVSSREKLVAKARNDGKLSGWLFGPLSFLFRES
jgi:Zn-finger nucleic acid-binding protein